MKPVFPALWLSLRGAYALLGLSLALAVAGFVPWLLYAVLAAAVVVSALIAADALLGPGRLALRVARQPVPPLGLGRRATVRYVVQNRSRLAVRLGILETPVPGLRFEAEDCRARLPAGSRATPELAFVPRERGTVRFGALYVWAENALGLLRRRYRIESDEDVRVLPDFSLVEGYGTLAKRSTLVDAGLRRLRMRGAGTEFESLREYGAGDAFRQVDWKATARRGRLMVAQYEAERSQNVVIALDCGRLMTPRLGPARKFDYALTAALSVARVAQAADDNVGLVAFAARPLISIAPRRGAAHVRSLVRATFDLQPRFEEPDYETAFAALLRRYSKRSLIVLFTDIFDPVTSAAVIAGLATLVPRHLVMCVLMNDAALANALENEPGTPAEAYRTAVAMTLADERAEAIAVLRKRGIIVVDVAAAQLTVALLDAYLDVKARGRI